MGTWPRTYTPQPEVYAGLLANLKTAAEQLDPAGPTIDKDILFGSDIVQWQRFANSLRLRLANRQAASAPAESRAVFAEIMGSPDRYPIVTSLDNALFFTPTIRQSDNNNNTWHEVMVFDSREDWSISTTLVDAMTDAGGNATDERLTVYAKVAQAGDRVGNYAGAPNGLPEGDAVAYFTTASRPGDYFLGETTPIPLITLAETNFILAEASLDGDYTDGLDAAGYLEAGVRASFSQYGFDMPASYLVKNGVTKEQIMTEKWKALFSQGIEAWTEYRRTGYPVLPPPDPRAVMENDGKVPTRLRYPESEYSLNAGSVTAAVKMNGGPDNKLTPLWWAE